MARSLMPDAEGESSPQHRVAHIAPKVDALRGFVEGSSVKALCGVEFVPSGDALVAPRRCVACDSIYAEFDRDRRGDTL